VPQFTPALPESGFASRDRHEARHFDHVSAMWSPDCISAAHRNAADEPLHSPRWMTSRLWPAVSPPAPLAAREGDGQVRWAQPRFFVSVFFFMSVFAMSASSQ